MRFLLTTVPGLEEIVADELDEKLPGSRAEIRPYGRVGRVRVEASAVDELLRLTTIHHVIEIRGESEARTPDQVAGALAGIEYPELRDAASFRVTSKHEGGRDFGKLEIQRAAGAVLHGRYGTPVDLEGFEVNVRVDLYEGRLIAGVQRTRDSLGNRLLRVRPLRSSLKPTVAAAMLRLAGAHRGVGTLIDPMCGAGTIPVEALRINPDLEVWAADWDPRTVALARETVAGHDLDIEVREADARSLGDSGPERFDYIVTDPPYGVRQARRTSISRLYSSLLSSFVSALRRSGKIVLVVVKHRAFLAALDGTGLRVVESRVIDLGGVQARIFVLERG